VFGFKKKEKKKEKARISQRQGRNIKGLGVCLCTQT
jgi:hypothetical protein